MAQPLVGMIAWFFGGMFFVNATPHFVSGVCGRPFPSPFAKPPGRGMSSPVVNVIWGTINFVISYLLLYHVFEIHLYQWLDVLIFGVGGFIMAFMLAAVFGKRLSGA
jgi:hypothetical protein